MLSKETLNAFLNVMPAVLYEYQQSQSGSGFLRYISPNCKEILGYPPDYFLADFDNMWGIVHPEDLPRLKAEDEATVNDESFKARARIILPSDEIKWIKIVSKPASKIENGDVVWNGCVIDVTQLVNAKEEVIKLQGIIPICTYCKSIRSENGAWNKLEKYIEENSEAHFSHGICDKCMESKFPDQYKKLKKINPKLFSR